MSKQRVVRSFFDPQRGMPAVRLQEVTVEGAFEPARTNYFSIYWMEAGSGAFFADAGRFDWIQRSLLFFTPYQYIRIEPVEAVPATCIQFHANFLCIETFHAETGCAGPLFNDAYHAPAVSFGKREAKEVVGGVRRMIKEQQERASAFEEVMLAQLKMLLILATRTKTQMTAGCPDGGTKLRHPVLGQLKQLIDENYAALHSPSDYAKRLHMTSKTLGRVVREQLGKSLTDLIRERILTHAKWQLLHTLKPVKEVAREVGFADELYFSRMFKKATGCSPTFFRDFETEIRGGSNLSMLSPVASILSPGHVSR